MHNASIPSHPQRPAPTGATLLEHAMSAQERRERAALLVAAALRRALKRPGSSAGVQRFSPPSLLDSRVDERLTGPRQLGAFPGGEK